ncbi:MAG: hypothetical protein Ta2D_09590 [Rickettsiales bacterium]|nr:MAG: hypothetical protein Ta2D_09590 [Rickettsiales bacterium]
MKKFLLFYFVVICSVFATEISEIEKYLDSIKTFEANFIQDDITGGALSEGLIYISRPDKLRVDYTHPFKAQVFTIGEQITYYDQELDEISNIPTGVTPLHFLLRKQITFADFIVKKNEDKSDSISISIQEKKNKKQGTLFMTFTKNPLALKSIRIKNELEQEIEMDFHKTKTNQEIKSKIFDFVSPRLKKKI